MIEIVERPNDRKVLLGWYKFNKAAQAKVLQDKTNTLLPLLACKTKNVFISRGTHYTGARSYKMGLSNGSDVSDVVFLLLFLREMCFYRTLAPEVFSARGSMYIHIRVVVHDENTIDGGEGGASLRTTLSPENPGNLLARVSACGGQGRHSFRMKLVTHAHRDLHSELLSAEVSGWPSEGKAEEQP